MRRAIFPLVGAGLLAVLVFHLGVRQIATMMRAVGWGFVGIALFYTAHQLARAAALWACVPRGHAVSYRDAVLIRLSGEAIRFLTFSGPFVAEPTKAWLFKTRGLAAVEGAAAIATEYLAYTLLSAAMSTTVLTYFLRRTAVGPSRAALSIIIPALFAAGAFAAVVALAHGRRPIAGTVRALSRLPVVRARWHPNLESIRGLESRLQDALRERPTGILGILAIETGAQALLVAEAYWILRALEVVASPLAPFIIEGGAKMSSAFFVIPGQIGAAEAMYAVLFNALGLSSAAGFVMAFIRRLRTLLIAGLGVIALWTLLRMRTRSADSQ